MRGVGSDSRLGDMNVKKSVPVAQGLGISGDVDTPTAPTSDAVGAKPRAERGLRRCSSQCSKGQGKGQFQSLALHWRCLVGTESGETPAPAALEGPWAQGPEEASGDREPGWRQHCSHCR